MFAAISAASSLPAAPAAAQPLLPSIESLSFIQLAMVRPPVAVAKPPRNRVVEVKKGDTLIKLLIESGVAQSEAHEAISALRKIYNPRDLMPGYRVTLSYRRDAAEEREERLQRISLDDGILRRVGVERNAQDGFRTFDIVKKLTRKPMRVAGTITSSLYKDGADLGLPAAILVEFVHLYSWDVDFQRDVRPGDSFELVYDRYVDAEGRPVRDGDIVYAVLTVGGERKVLYRFEHGDGETDYFDENGESARKPLMRTPVDGATLSSRFGQRKHPVLGYTKLHQGVDFAAPPGSPIFAAGDGTIVKRGTFGGYGRYILIRHKGAYSTAYAHMRAFRGGLKIGSKVKQGQVIGYVGSSGRSTGPHLHYEVHVDDKAVNPLALKMPAGWKLKRADLKRFEITRLGIDREVASLAAPKLQTASVPAPDTGDDDPTEEN